jgi:hypothetical protein
MLPPQHVIASDSNGNFKAEILGSTGTSTLVSTEFSLNESDPNFVRKVFNTNPQAVSTVTSATNRKTYWLGETFGGQIARLTGFTDTTSYGTILGRRHWLRASTVTVRGSLTAMLTRGGSLRNH